ncbi:hypothetical protein [Nostoc sp. CMAA1605]|uniref:hypothetical protein n=1 Tax=Nostoc sp. CMAA1605 TaxID=2055159 RepID=UPI001F40BE13|nr:hypothetical protein [Nostoc sp. CMAA1605]MCF4966005.1 hypothetical protein [Nostoc sp. CMAA1605]
MRLLKLILLACPVFIASIIMVASPANANPKPTFDHQGIAVESVQSVADIVVPHLTSTSNPITEQLGCNCANCLQSKFQLLQGKLPSVDF